MLHLNNPKTEKRKNQKTKEKNTQKTVFLSKVFQSFGFLVFMLTSSSPIFAQQPQTECPPECTIDTMEIVTWYPSPYNEYEELRLYPTQRDPGDCDNDKIGLMYYDHGGTPSFPEDDKIKICKGISLGWEDIGASFWQQLSGDDISNTNSGKVTINGNMQADDIYLTTLGKWLSQVIPINLLNAIHTSAQCYDLGGTLVDDGTGKKMCKFSGSSCPGGWSKYLNWSTTTGISKPYYNENCEGYTVDCTRGCLIDKVRCPLTTSQCVPNSHNFGNTPLESSVTCAGTETGYYENGRNCNHNMGQMFQNCGWNGGAWRQCSGATTVTVSSEISEIGCY